MTVPVRPGLFVHVPSALLGSRCEACGDVRFPTSDICAACQSTNVAIIPLSRSGIIYTFTIVRNKPPGYLGDVPYAFGFVDLSEGLRVITTLIAEDLATLSIGDVVHFELFALGSGEDAVESYRYRRGSEPQ